MREEPPRRGLSRGLGLSALWVDRPAPVEAVPVVGSGPAIPTSQRRLKVLSWNLQFCAGRHTFFYEGGDRVSVSAADVRTIAEQIGRVIADEQADLVLLQEVDRGSRRTAGLDELGLLLDRAPYPVWLSTRYHRCRYLPYPWREPLGRVEMHLCTLSRLPLIEGRRIALPPMAEPLWRQQLNLRRAILSARVRGLDLAVGNTHLSAFANGDGTLARQIAVADAWCQAERSFVLGGDFNCLPPGDSPARLGAGAVEYSDPVPPISALIPKYVSAISPDRLARPESRTYLPPGQLVADRTLDYVFVGPSVTVERSWVRDDVGALSDHLPLIVELRLGD